VAEEDEGVQGTVHDPRPPEQPPPEGAGGDEGAEAGAAPGRYRHHRGRPEPDVGGPLLRLLRAADLPQLGRAGNDGLGVPCRHRREGRPPRRPGGRHSRRRELRHDGEQPRDLGGGGAAGGGRHPQQQDAGDGGPVAAALLRPAIRRRRAGRQPRLRQAGGGIRRRGRQARLHRGVREGGEAGGHGRGADGHRRPHRPGGERLPHGPAGEGAEGHPRGGVERATGEHRRLHRGEQARRPLQSLQHVPPPGLQHREHLRRPRRGPGPGPDDGDREGGQPHPQPDRGAAGEDGGRRQGETTGAEEDGDEGDGAGEAQHLGPHGPGGGAEAREQLPRADPAHRPGQPHSRGDGGARDHRRVHRPRTPHRHRGALKDRRHRPREGAAEALGA